MTHRDEFLARIARAVGKHAGEAPLPSLAGVGSSRGQLTQQFEESLRAAAGKPFRLADHGSLEALLSVLECYRAARTVCSLVPGVAKHNVDLAVLDDSRGLGHVNVAVLSAELGVAENGAVWLTPKGTLERGLLFLSEHVVVLLDETRIVDDMHRAYERIDVTSSSFGCFVSGPSKTADIEQALVIGAHGPRSFSVVMT